MIDLTPDQMEKLSKQLEKMERKEVPQETEEVEEPSEEDIEKIQQIQAEIERLQNAGAFRVELIYQLLGVNANLNRIAIMLEKLGEGNGK